MKRLPIRRHGPVLRLPGGLVDDSGSAIRGIPLAALRNGKAGALPAKTGGRRPQAISSEANFALGQGPSRWRIPTNGTIEEIPLTALLSQGITMHCLRHPPFPCQAPRRHGQVDLLFQLAGRMLRRRPATERTTKRPASEFPTTTEPVLVKCSAGNRPPPALSLRTMPPTRPWSWT